MIVPYSVRVDSVSHHRFAVAEQGRCLGVGRERGRNARMTIRFKLTMGFLGVLAIANSVLSVVAVSYLSHVWLDEVQTRVRMDLNAARAAYDAHVDHVCVYLNAAASDPRWPQAVAAGDQRALRGLVDSIRERGGMDIVNLIGPDGRVICRARSEVRGDDQSSNPLVAGALKSGLPSKGTIIVSSAQLKQEDPALAERARAKVLPTTAAKPSAQQEQNDGMVAGAVVSVKDPDGAVLGVLLGGTLLNGRYEIVDAIRDEVFPANGTVTIFQNDVRIATNVPREDGSRAVGTRMSEVVHDAVLSRGEIWADRAFVVREWYITSYEPLRDPTGRIIGSLYVGLPEAPFVQKKRAITAVVVAIVVGATLLSLALVFIVTQLVLRPVGRIVEMSRRVIAGDLTARVGICPPGEMGLLCQAIDAMGEAVADREKRLKETTRQQMNRSEQLAAIGRLAAGVAHEINNPLTAVLTFAHLLRDKHGSDRQDRQDLDMVINEATRAAEIVRDLLDFARERPVQWDLVDLNEITRQTIHLVRSHKQARQVKIIEELNGGLPLINGDQNQLQQVLINLLLNACEAMPEGGTLTVRSRRSPHQAIIEVIDTGHGIKPEHAGRIFEPFFTTKPVGKGTGLGLSVSYGIVSQHNGTLEFESQEGKGTTFRMALPVGGHGLERAMGNGEAHE